jgi:pantoate--beta-alanine ligase
MNAPVVHTIEEVRAAVARARGMGLSVAFVPTMGALHEGHAALIRAAVQPASFVVVSVFVNPTQFGPNEDFAKYPRTLDADQAVCSAAGANLIFAPSAAEMYPEGSVAFVDVAKLGDVLCGASRPGHFRGVCTVVLKLFNIVQPDAAHFGAKDWQQATIIKRMVRDLDVPVRIVVEPTVREADGLALSSRNRYLSPHERAAAPMIHSALLAIRHLASNGQHDASSLQETLHELLAAIPGARVDYARIVHAETLEPVEKLDRPAVAAVAVFLGTTRLIDNISLS